MRLPLKKIHRGFPELDVFSDEDCERYILQVRSQHRVLTLSFAGAALALLVWIFFILPLGIASLSMIPGSAEYTDTAIVVMILVGAVAVCMSFLLLRDWLLIRGIRNRINNARCIACRHSLLGLPLLPADECSVRCPECGSITVLREIGLKPDDLRPREASDVPVGQP